MVKENRKGNYSRQITASYLTFTCFRSLDSGVPISGQVDSAPETSGVLFSPESYSGLLTPIPAILEDVKDVSMSSSLLAGVRAAAGLRWCLSFVAMLSRSKIRHKAMHHS